MRPLSTVTLLLATVLAGDHLAAGDDAGQDPPFFAADLAYSEPLAFDYDRDGTLDRVQFWVRVAGRPAVGDPGVADHAPEVGALSYFVYDLDREQKIENWLMGFNMGFPQAGTEFPLANIQVKGYQARFDFRGTTWILEDGGPDLSQDSVELRDHRGPRAGRFYGGDVRVVPDPLTMAGPVDLAANRECNECHHESAVSIAALGGPHREFECNNCHLGHPPDHSAAIPQCINCHEGHDPTMAAESCGACHGSHAVERVTYAATVNDGYCSACHNDVATTIQASGSRHMGLGCALCHQDVHGAEAKSCVFCHRGTHPEHVMRDSNNCTRCHDTAHALDRGRDD